MNFTSYRKATFYWIYLLTLDQQALHYHSHAKIIPEIVSIPALKIGHYRKFLGKIHVHFTWEILAHFTPTDAGFFGS